MQSIFVETNSSLLELADVKDKIKELIAVLQLYCKAATIQN